MTGDAPTRSPETLAKILVVDDDNLFGKVMSFKLKGAGYHVMTALDGAEAISIARVEKPDLILLDLTFPPDVSGSMTDGFGIMKWLRHMVEFQNVSFIIITGDDDLKNRERAIASGAAAFFNKPAKYDELLNAIRAALNGHVAQPKPEPTPH